MPQALNRSTAIINDNNTITHTPDAGFYGMDVFVYRGINERGKIDTQQSYLSDENLALVSA